MSWIIYGRVGRPQERTSCVQRLPRRGSADSIVPVVPPDVGKIPYPMATKNFHHEIELVVAIGASGVKIAPEQAQPLIYGYAVGLDMTRRDLQHDMREKKRPWDIGKSFANAAPNLTP